MHPIYFITKHSDRLTVLPDLTCLAMFPCRWPNLSEIHVELRLGQRHRSRHLNHLDNFVEGDMMSPQSQAQSQAQTQAQLAHLREQNTLLNQQLASQAQTHVQQLQQLLPFHQPPQSSAPHQTPSFSA